MKTIKLKIILLAFGSVFLTSCTSLLYTSLDVLRPASISFAPEANNLLLVNNSITQPPELGHKTELLNQNTKYVLLSSDSLAIFCLATLKEDMEGKNFFNSIKMLTDSKNQGIDFSTIKKLDPDSVKNLCADAQANVILSLDRIKVNDLLTEFYLPENNSYLSTLELKFETVWTVGYPDKSETSTVLFKDTVYWEAESLNAKTSLSKLPDRQNALIDGALYVGHKSIDRFIPHWDKVDRYFFNSGNKLMKQAMDSVYVKNWKSAILNWKNAIKTTKNNSIIAQAENNIAIAYEIIGNVDMALDYATQSNLTMRKQDFIDIETFMRMTKYIEELKIRQKDIATLKVQLGEE